MAKKLSRRLRYILKWNGPNCVDDLKRQRQYARANMGGRNDSTEACRMASTAYFCRFQGYYPKTDVEFCRLAGVPTPRRNWR